MERIWKPQLKFFSKVHLPDKVSISQRKQRILRGLKLSLKFFSSNCLFPSRKSQVLHEPPSDFLCPNYSLEDPAFIEGGRELNCICASVSRTSAAAASFESTLEILDSFSHEEVHEFAKKSIALDGLFWTVFTNVADDQEPPLINPRTSSISIAEASNSRNHPSCSYFSKAMDTINRSSKAASSIIASTDTCNIGDDIDSMEKEILRKLRAGRRSVREEALISLYESARKCRDYRIALCSHNILANLIPKLHPRHPATQIIKATAAIAMLSEEPSIRITIVQSGALCRLVALLKNRDVAACDLAARAIKNLALEERNKEFIGSSTDTISALVDHFCDPSVNYPGRKYAGTALCHLTFSFPDNLIRLAKTEGAVWKLLKLTIDRSNNEAMKLGGFAMVLMWKLAWIREAREALIEAGAVGEMVRMVREGEGKDDEYCLAVMYQTCDHNVELFKGLAIAAGAEEVLAQDKEGWGEVGRDMARRMLGAIRHVDNESVELLQRQSVDKEVKGIGWHRKNS